jgi:hypothetical protein
MLRSTTAKLVLIGLFVTISAAAVEARCTRLAFSVNDYGKDGPTKDAKDLLDKHIAKWAADNGIKKYTTGKKSVSCELYLDLLLFDEHTCKAEASVCWGDGAAPAATRGPAKSAPTPADAPGQGSPKTPAAKPDAPPAPKAKAAALN